MRSGVYVACVALAWLGVPPRAFAAPTGQPFRLEYWARGHCPDAAEFARQIQTRAPRLRPAEGDEPALGFYAELLEHPGVATGRLTARSPDGREVTREVRGATCDDVVTALALIAALAADPNQALAAPPKPVEKAPSQPAPAEPPERDPDLSEVLPRNPADRWTFGVGGGLGFDSTIAPNPGYGLSAEFEAEGRGGSALRGLFSLAANRAAAANTETHGSSAAFTWTAFRLAVCPLRWPEQTPLYLRPCVFADAGLLEANVALGTRSRNEAKSWFALGAFGRVEALVGEVVAFQLDGGLTAPLRHPDFRAGTADPSAFQVPGTGILGRIGLSYRFQ